jgi:hypothetical protein
MTMMMTACPTPGSGIQDLTRLPRSVVAVSREAQPAALVEALLSDASDFDVIVVESLAHGYSRIKQLTPDVVIVLLETNHELAACQLLSMLQIDVELSGTLVLTCMMGHTNRAIDVIVAERPGDLSCLSPATQTH